MIDIHLRKLRARDDISAAEEAAIRAAVSGTRPVDADETFIHAGELLTASTILLTGLMCRFKDMSNGGRQITELHVPGDFVDLHSFTLKQLDHDVMTLTPARLANVPHDNLRRITERFPHITRMYWFSTNLDAVVHREWELSLGRRTARARLATLLSELHLRLRIVGLADANGYDLSLTQTDLAECTGLTNVHVNRTLRELREEGLVALQAGRVTIIDRLSLWRVGEFDPRYLYLDPDRLGLFS